MNKYDDLPVPYQQYEVQPLYSEDGYGIWDKVSMKLLDRKFTNISAALDAVRVLERQER